jgi:hypothetical protein
MEGKARWQAVRLSRSVKLAGEGEAQPINASKRVVLSSAKIAETVEVGF